MVAAKWWTDPNLCIMVHTFSYVAVESAGVAWCSFNSPFVNTLVFFSHQALHSRDSLQLEYTDCLLDKNRLRKRIAELQANLEQQQGELERERERSREQMEQSNPCLNCVS